MVLKTRLKRLRRTPAIRELLKETELSAAQLIQPYFVVSGTHKKKAIPSMPGVFHLSVDEMLQDIARIRPLGVRAVLLFGIADKKDPTGRPAFVPSGVVQKAIRAIKQKFGDSVVVFTDVCLCGYLPHGHCGVVRGKKIDTEATNQLLAKVAVSHARAGADFVAPSAMADGQVKAIRTALDRNGFGDTGILAYSVKYASHFYGPFREALDSTPGSGDRKSYQIQSGNSDEALREAREDINEGADMIMVKPATPYLDVLYRLRKEWNIPVAAYHVSGEYSILKNAAQNGLLDERGAVLEVLTGIKRAGADLIITYYAGEVAKWLK